MQTKNDLILTRSEKELDRVQSILDDINEAYRYAKSNNDYFVKHKKFIDQKSLNSDDEAALESQDMPSMTFPILKPIKSQQLKNVRDSAPESIVKPLPNIGMPDNVDAEARADWYTQKLEAIYKRNHLEMRTYAVADNAFSGGFGVYKVKADYLSNMTFDMTQFIENVEDPTRILFDPSAKHPTKKDAEFVIELDFVVEPVFKRLYPSVDIDELQEKSKGNSTEIKWIEQKQDQRHKTITVANYYYKDYEKKTIYSVTRPGVPDENGIVQPIEMVIFDDPIENPIITIDGQEIEVTPNLDDEGNVLQRDVDICTIKRIRLVDSNVIQDEKSLNFTELPFIFVPGELVTVNGEPRPRAYLESAIDAQRAKNYMASYFLDATLNAKPAMLCVSGQSMTQEDFEKMLNNAEKNILPYIEYGMEGAEMVQYSRPYFLTPEPINPAYLAFFESIDETINKILGSFQISYDQSNMSGKALYNMSAYINASIEPFMFNLMLGIEQLGKVILSSFKFINSSEQASGTNPKTSKEYSYTENYEMDAAQFGLYVSPGINFKLQQQATIEWLIDLSDQSPQFAQFLYSAGMEFLLDNADLNSKQKLIASYKQYMMEHSQRPQEPSPDMIRANADTIKANADMIEAQTKQQTAGANVQIKAMENATELSRQRTETYNTELKEASNHYETTSKNRRHLVDHLANNYFNNEEGQY